jgi:hypothetical protein
MQGSLSIERICQLAGVSRAGFYRSLLERAPVEEDMEVRSVIGYVSGLLQLDAGVVIRWEGQVPESK